MIRKLSVWKIIILALLTFVLALVFILTILYRDMLFRDYENNDFAKSDKSISFLFVGNSDVFWGKLPRQLHIISKKYGVEITYKDISSNGAHLSRSKDEAIKELQNASYDYIVLQDNTRLLPGGIDDFLSTIRLLCDIAIENGTTPVLFNPAVTDSNRLKINSDAYLRASADNAVVLVNAGEAWAYAYQTSPKISLYAWDGIHANNAGAFLTSCVFAAVLFDLHIEEIPSDNLYKGGDALLLAQSAWELNQN
ncbi:MAG: hypothetical protein FWH01_06835 [Oscillospiraceae bacterium]|nr:hypothetical protein [Oscillospiraceae bacterium]